MPGLSRLKSIEIDLIFSRRTVGTCFARRLLEIAAGSIIEKEQLIAGHRHRMLPNWRQRTWRQGQGECTQRRILIPVLCRIAQNPLNGSRVVIKRDNKVFPAGNDQ